jgi:hypothetical protein
VRVTTVSEQWSWNLVIGILRERGSDEEAVAILVAKELLLFRGERGVIHGQGLRLNVNHSKVSEVCQVAVRVAQTAPSAEGTGGGS